MDVEVVVDRQQPKAQLLVLELPDINPEDQA